MMDWTDRHCRFFHRLLTKNTLYTEMLTVDAVIFGPCYPRLRIRQASTESGPGPLIARQISPAR
jgi:tRNA-dihydrouridine synthase